MAKPPVFFRPPGPMVSVVIPTHGRPDLVQRALRTALGQTFQDLEVIVVVDGRDEQTAEALSRIEDERLHVLCLEHNVGGSEARNTGVRYARGKWIAFLDDDDEWFPAKIEKQWEIGESVGGSSTIVASRLIERTEMSERVLPRRPPLPGEPICEYLFVRKGWNSGEGFIQTSTWFVSRELLIRVPFTTGLKRCQDLDWLLRAAALPETVLRLAPDVLAVFHHDEQRQRVSRAADWRFLFDWAQRNRQYINARAFSFLIATLCVPSAAKQKAGVRTFLFLLRQCIACGAATARCLALFMICWCVPEAARRNLRAWMMRMRAAFERRSSHHVPAAVPGKVA